ncbi:MAG: hypothetical protein AVDCRST_MAG59-1359 [uncultured Thermomicrobiales bacterium]|uniref:Uncharacterized protein n=1 Tax=uncultured Thermomicrobiales bacterium TaxID=1645740 RepID=A0A6J4UD17_9BACT|nr:MAG: hypothetical protein AVDCRST_MAG59-1359 [uncultured Thermomicrobiales bacterium]
MACIEGADAGRALGRFGASQDASDEWSTRRLAEANGVDPGNPPPGRTPPEPVSSHEA